MGARICNTGTTTATNVNSSFVWDTTNTFINLSGASSQTVGTGTLTAGACYDVYYNVVITRTSSAYNTARRFHITATADGGVTASTPTPREIYVEKLVSQNRNSVTSITGPSTVYVGQQYTYTVISNTATGGYAQLEAFTVFNNLIYRIDSISTTYTAPAGGTNDKLYADACGWDADPTSATYRSCIGPANYTGGKAGGTVTTTYTVTVLSPGSASLGTLIYDFSGSSYHYNSDLDNPLTTIATTALPAADLVMEKTVTAPSSSPYLNGQNLTYTLKVTNNGPNTAVAPVITDDLPAGVTYVSSSPACSYVTLTRRLTCNLADLASGANTSVTLTVTPTAAGSLSNTASVASPTMDLVTSNNSSTSSITVVPAADLSIAKAVTSPSSGPFYNGQNLTYTLTVSNAGPNTAVTPTITDTLPSGVTFVSASSGCSSASGTVTCVLADIASGGSRAVTVTVTANTSGVATNAASVTSTTADPSSSNNATSIDTTITPSADLVTTKTVNDATPAFGANVTFTVTVKNNGPDAATGVSVTDALPPGLSLVSAAPSVGSYASGTWTVGSLTSGAQATLSIVATVTSSTSVTNSAAATTTTHDPDTTNNAASVAVDALDADLVVTKTVDTATPAANGNVTFTVIVKNNGPDTAAGVSVADALPSGLTLVSATPSAGSYASGTWTVGALANGVQRTLTIVAQVTTLNAVTNTATASTTTYEPDTSNNAASAGVNVQDADLIVTKSVDNGTPAFGGNVTFTVTVTNNGADTATGVSVADALPSGLTLVSATPSVGSFASGTWTVGSLATGARATLSIVATANTAGAVTNSATATTTAHDPNAANNTATADVDVLDADLAVTKTVDNATPAVGANVTFTVTVENTALNTAAGVTVADALPTGLTLVSATPSTGTYASGTWTVGSLAPGAQATMTVVATVTTHTAVTNTATAATTTYEPNTTNNGASAGVDAQDVDLVVTKSVDNAAPALGANVTFTVTVQNNGPSTAAGVSIADALPSGLTLVSATPSVGSYASGTWTVGSLANAAQATMTVVATVTVHTALTNTATGSSTTFEADTANNAASAGVDVPDANLAIAKSVDNATPALGANVTFTLTATNNGPDAAANVVVADALPSGLTLVSATPSVGSYSGGVWTIGAFANGASSMLSVVATVTSNALVTNTATISSSTLDPTSANDSASASVDVPDANLAVTKSVDSATPVRGTDATFTVTVTNNGPQTAVGVSVADALPTGLSLVSATPSVGTYAAGTWTVGDLANGASATLVVVATVNDHLALTNTATATSSTHDPVPANNSASAQVNAPDADLEVTKTVDAAQPEVGGNVTFTVSVTNNGPDAATGVSVADALPSGLALVSATPSTGSYASGVWNVGGLANGAAASLSIVATVNAASTITNTATVTGNPYDPATGNNTAAVSVNAAQADIAVTKSVDTATPTLGANVTFTVTATNNGPNAAAGVVVTDVLPAGLNLVSATPSAGTYASGAWNVGTVSNGAAPTLQIVATVAVLTPVTNTATAAATTHDPATGNNSASAGVDVPNADLSVAKSVSNATPAVGAAVTFTVTVTNDGPDTATGVQVADALPSGLTLVSANPSAGSYASGVWTVGDVPNGASRTLDIVATVDGPSAVTNTATVTASTADQSPGNNSASADVDAVEADIAVTKTVDNAAPAIDTDVTYTVTVTNNGPDTASAVSVVDSLPSGLTLVSATPSAGTYASGVWTVGTMANGVSRTLTIVATVTSASAITNTASSSSSTFDPATGNNTSSVAIDVPDTDLAVTKTVNDAAPALGANVTFTVTVTNNGPIDASAVQLADALPSGLTLVSATPSTGSYSGGVWTVGALANGTSETLGVVATANSHLAQLNTAVVSSSTYDTTPGNNSASATVDVPDADLAVTKTVDDATPTLGGTVTFTIDVTNAGTDTAGAVTVTDVLPAGLTLVSATPSTGIWTALTGTWSVGSVTPGATPSLAVVATVTSASVITNTATVASTTYDPASGNNTASAVVSVSNAELAIAKSVDDATPAVGSDVVFTVTVTNNGPEIATGVEVADALPSGLTLVSAVPSSGTYAAGVWTIGTMASGATRTLTVTATVTSHLAISNTATVSSTSHDPNPANDVAAAVVNARDADLELAKSVDDTTPEFGGTVTFTLDLTNHGPDTATGINVSDVLPAGLSFVSASSGAYDGGTGVWTVGALASGATTSLEIVATVGSTSSIVNGATATASTFDPVAGNNSGTATLTPRVADLAVTKSVDTPSPALGANVTFTVAVTNNGPATAAGVHADDLLPAGFTFVSASTGAYDSNTGVWTIGSLANGASASLDIVATVTSIAAVSNTVTASATTFDPDGSDNTASAVVDVPQADLAITKSVSNATPGHGTNVTFTLTATNDGPDPAAGVTVSDLLPAGLVFVSASSGAYDSGTGVWSIGSLANGASVTLTVVATVADHVALTNTATIAGDTHDPAAANNSASATVNAPDANLVLAKTVSSPTPVHGSDVTYTLTLANTGADTATAATVTDLLPAGLSFVSATPSVGTYAAVTGTWTVGDLAAASVATLDIVATVTDHTPITNSATATSTVYDPVPGDNTDSVDIDAPDADLEVAKTVSNATPAFGTNVTFTVIVTNHGPVTATAMHVDDLLPAGLSYVSATPTTGTYASGTGVWTVGDLATGASEQIDLVATVDSASAITNTATGTSAVYDPNTANNTGSAQVDAPQTDVAIAKIVSDAAPAIGTNVTFTLTATNNGPDTAAAVAVSDLLPAGLTYVSSTPSTGSYDSGTGVWTVGAMANAATATLQIVATVTSHLAITNTATITTDTHEATAANNSATAGVDVRDADVSVTKSVDVANPATGTDVNFLVTVANAGADTAQAVTVTDLLPPGFTYVSSAPSTGSYASGTGVWAVGALAAGASETLAVRATVTTHIAITNTATVTTTTYDPTTGDHSATAAVDAPDADLAVTKSVDNANPQVGTDVTFTIAVQNNGSDMATATTVTDVLPAGLTFVSATPSVGSYASGTGVWTVGDLASGASATMTITATVTIASGMTNTATATSDVDDPNPANNAASAAVGAQAANLAVTKTVTDATPVVGDLITFTVTVTNNGPDAATAVSVADALPAGLTPGTITPSTGSYAAGVWTLGTLADGASATLQMDATVTSATAVTNTAIASSGTFDPDTSDNAASRTVDAIDADVAITKTVSNATPDVGDTVTFTITAHNNGPDAAAAVVVNDSLPAGLTFASSTPSTGSYNSGTGVWTVGALANGATATLSIDATVGVRTALTNTATISTSTTDTNLANNTASAGVDARDADLTITKAVSDATPQVGQDVTFTITVANAGPDDAQSVAVTDQLPAGLTSVSAIPSTGTYDSGTGIWTLGTVGNGATATLTIVATVTGHTSVTNTATLASTTFDPTTGDHTASAAVDARNADLAIAKSVDDSTPEVGQLVDFTIAVTNNGPDTATAVVVTDVLPAGLTFSAASTVTGAYDDGTGSWTVGDLADGSTATLTISATVTVSAPLTNTASVGAATFDPQTSDNTDTADVDGREANLQVTKIVDDASPALGDTVRFTVTVTNNGPDDASGVAVADLLPAALGFVAANTASGSYDDLTGGWTVGALANGATATLTIDATVSAIAAVTNSATATSSTFDPDTSDNAASATVDVPQADLAVTKNVDTPAPLVGGTVRFTVTVTNNGPDTAAAVAVADTVPAGLTVQAATPSSGSYDGTTWTVGSLASGASATLTVDATVDVDAAITNTATATTPTHDTNLANNDASASVDASTADLTVTKTVDNATPAFGTNVTFTVTATNNGPDTAQSVSVADALPPGLTPVSANPSAGTYAAGVWTVGSLANGATATLTMVATVATTASVTNTATASTASNDVNAANDSAGASVDAPAANIALTKIVDNPSPSVGTNVTYTVTVTNNGPDAATGVHVDDLLPAGLTFQSATPSAGSYDSGTGVWTVGALANGDSETLSITAQVLSGGAITNTATGAAVEHDPDLADNTDAVALSGVRADLEVTKSVDTPNPAMGATVTFAITITNHGPDDAPAAIVDDPLPAGLSFVSATPSTGTYTAGTGVWSVGTLANGATETLTLRATVGSASLITNTAIGSSAIVDPTPADATDTATVNVPDADLSVAKTVDTSAPALGGTVQYTVTVTNNGPDAAAGVRVDDLMPAGLTFGTATPSVGSYAPGTGVWTVGALANGVSQTLTIDATVTSSALMTNSATVTATTLDPNAANNTASVDVDVPDADITVSKSVDDAAPALGTNVTYTITVQNSGPASAAGVAVTDALPAGLTFVSATPSVGTYVAGTGVWTVGNLANGASATLDLVATVTSAAPITNTATATSTTHDPVTPNSDSAVVDVPQADVRVSKTVTDATPAAGANVMFTVTVTNDGPNDAAGVAVADALPPGLSLVSAVSTAGTYAAGVWTVGPLADGASESLDVIATVSSSASITNTATASATTLDPDLSNNGDAATVDTPDADLAVTKTVDDPTPTAGGPATYTVTVVNNGPNGAPAVQVDDLLPVGVTFASAAPSVGTYSGGVWDIGTLASGASATLDITVTVNSGALVTNTATVRSDAADANPANDSDSVDIDAPDADLSVVKTVNTSSPAVNANVTYTVAVTNNGPDSAPAVSVADTLPSGLTFVSSSASQGTYSGGVWTIGAMNSGASETLDIVATVTSSALITNTATVSSGAADPDGTNDSDSVDVDVPESDVAVTKIVDTAAPALNTDVTFTVTVTNNGPNPATGVDVADALPTGLTLVSATPSTGSYASGVWSIGAMASGATETMDVVATVTSAAAVTNTATASSTSYDGTAGNNVGSASVDVPDADLSIVKTVSDTTPALNDNVTYHVVVTNNGPAIARNVIVTDNLPAGVAFVSSSAFGYGGGTWNVGDLANGASATLDIVVQVTSASAITNSASAASDTHDPDGTNNSDAVDVDVPEADLVLTKSVDTPAPRQGENVTYTVTLTNQGPDSATGIDVTDVLPPELTAISVTPTAGTVAGDVWTVATLANGASATLTIVARVDAQGTITNAAEVTASGVMDPTSTPADGVGDDADSVDITAGPPQADLALAMIVSNATPAVGGNITYTLTLTNHGPSATDNVTVVDLLPSQVTYVSSSASVGSYDSGSGTWTVGPMASGATVTLTITVHVDASGAIVNTAEVGSSDEVDPDSSPANGAASEDDQDSRSVTASGVTVGPVYADLSIVKSTSTASVMVGDRVTYAIVVTNSGPAAATNVRVLEPLPVQLQFVSGQTATGTFTATSGVWAIPSIANGGSATLLITATAVAPGSITNVAQIIASDQQDPDGPFVTTPGGPGGEQSSATVTAKAKPVPQTKLSIKKRAPKMVKAGGAVTITIVVKNTGTVPATGVVLQDCIPSGLSVSGSIVKARLKGGRVNWNLGVLQPGQTRVVTVKFRVDRDVRGIRGCAAVVAGANAAAVSDTARIRVVAGAAPRAPHPAVAG